MCVYLGATDDLMEITYFVLCRVVELSLFTCMMIFNAIKSKWNNTKAIEMTESRPNGWQHDCINIQPPASSMV